jgi:serine/threonine protein kinase
VNITSGRPTPITTFRPDASPAFVELIDRACSTDPERRLTSIEELRKGLKHAIDLRGKTPTTMGTQPLPKPAALVAPASTSVPLGTTLDAAQVAPTKAKFNYWIIIGTALVALLGMVVGALAF